MITQTATHKPPSRISQYWALTKPRVTQLAVFCAVIGMFLATDGFPGWHVLVWGTIGIWLLAGAAFAVNCLIEAEVDARMARTARRATAMGELSTTQTLFFSAILGGAGMGILYTMVNPLTMWLTFVTFVGYALIYTGLQVWLYSVALAACTLLPFAVGMSGWLYLLAAIGLNAVFLRYGWLVHKRYSDQIARKAFAWSI